MQGRLNLRERLLVVIGVALLPVLAVSVWDGVRDNRAATEQARSQLKFAASLLAAHQDRAVDAAEQLLAAIVEVPGLRTFERPRCSAYLQRLRDRHPGYANIALFTTEGQVYCQALGETALSVADRAYFRQAVTQRRFVMGEAVQGRASARAILPFAMPVIEDGKVVAVAVAALDLPRATEALAGIQVPAAARVSVTDRHGHLVMQVGEADAGERIEAQAQSRTAGEEGFIVRVGLSRASLTREIWRRSREELLAMAAVMLAAMAGVWWIGGRMIVKPAKQILGTVRRMEQGRLDARVLVNADGVRGEFARIGAAFNLMADSLQMRHAEQEAQLARLKETQGKLVESQRIGRVGNWELDLGTGTLWWSEQVFELFGVARENFRGTLQDFESLVHPDDRPKLKLGRDRALVGGELMQIECRIIRPDRTTAWVHVIGDTRRDPSGQPVWYGGMVQDVTQRKLAELDNTRLLAELQELNAQLESRIAQRTAQLHESNQELEAFSYSVSHDLRAPLAAISGFASALRGRAGEWGDERALHYLARIQAGVHKMEELIEALLQLSRLVRAQLEMTGVDLSALAREAVENLRSRDGQRNVDVRIEEGLSARGDPRLLRAVMENLVGNAWKFTASEAQPRVEVGRTAAGEFYVRDNGVGFDMVYADKLFTAFHRLHKDSEFPGTGIGLATVRRVIARHEGRVRAESAPGRGATFYFTL